MYLGVVISKLKKTIVPVSRDANEICFFVRENIFFLFGYNFCLHNKTLHYKTIFLLVENNLNANNNKIVEEKQETKKFYQKLSLAMHL